MNKEKMIIRGCMFAVNEMIGTGSVRFAHRKDGKWETIEWSEIMTELAKKLEAEHDE